jgi:hypothetical protein
MKLEEFEAKLATVSDAKLRQMLTASRASGPEVAVKMILAEAKRRGMGDLDAAGAPEAGAAEHAGYAAEAAGAADAAGAGAAEAGAESVGAAEAGAEGSPQTPPDWLSEETKSGMPIAVKILIVLILLGAILALAWKFTH